MKKLIVVAALAFATSAKADWPEKWTPTDTAFQLAFVGALTLDLWQTVYIGSPERCPTILYEMNPLLGRCPKPSRTAVYGVTAAAGAFAVAWLLPQPYRRIWQSVWIATEVGMVTRNFSLGVRLTF